MAFDLVSWIKSGFKTGKDAASIKETAQGVIANSKQVSQLLGSSAPVSWANEALTQLSSSEKNAGRKNQNGVDLSARDLQRASDWISGAAQSHIASGLSGRLDKRQAETSAQLSNLQSNVQNTLSGVGKGTLSAAEETALKAQAAKTQAKIDALSPFATLVGAKAGTTTLASGDVIPTANLDHGQRMNAAAERQAAIERAAGIATNVAGGSQATAANTAAPKATTIDNNVDGRAFVEHATDVSVGGTANNQGTMPSPVFVGPDGTSLYYIPSGTNQPQKITDPAQLQNLVGSGAVAPGDQSTYKPLASAKDWLTSQHPSSQTSTSTSDMTGGANVDMAQKFNDALAPYRDAITTMQQDVLNFNTSDYKAVRDAEMKNEGLDQIMDSMSRNNAALADLLSIQDRVPQTTLAAAQGTSITQGVLDRQRTNVLKDLAAAEAPIERMNTALQADYDARIKLVDDAVQNQKDADSFKLQKLGYALDYATANYTMAHDQAQTIYDAAAKDYENRVKAAETAAKDQKDALDAQQKAIADFYKEQGYVIDPTTGELAPTLALRNFQKSGSGGSGKTTAQEYANSILNGRLEGGITKVPVSMQQDVQDILDGIETAPGGTGPTISETPFIGAKDSRSDYNKALDAYTYLTDPNTMDPKTNKPYTSNDIFDSISSETGWKEQDVNDFIDRRLQK